MLPYQKAFIRLAIDQQVLTFGEFTLKSGRKSPYFFNAGRFQSGSALAQLGRFYAEALMHSQVPVDMVFGPAYKGIPLAAATAIALYDEHQVDLPYCFNRKEVKDHGEGGLLVGAPLAGRVVIVDDVITAGTAVREVMSIVRQAQATPAAVLIGLNRQERGQGKLSAIQEVEQEFGIPVISIISLSDIIAYLLTETQGQEALITQVESYRKEYGVE